MSFASIVGHRRVTALLSQAIFRETLPPTLLLVGPTGVGKYRVGRAVAAALNCLSPQHPPGGFAVDACGRCRSCDRIERNVHVDVLSLEPDDRASIKIDVVRDVLGKTSYRPFEGRRRVVLVRDADTLEIAAQNALLKSLEEPPAGTVFLLTTAVPGLLLPTVQSRCMRLRCGRLTEAEVATVLTSHYDWPEAGAREAAALADGSVGQALALGSTDLAVLRETALSLLHHTSRGAAVASRLQAAAVLVTTPARKERPREDVALALRLLASMLRDIELLNAGGDIRVLANAGLTKELRSLAPAFAGARAREAFGAVDRAIMALDRNAGTKVVSEWLATQI